MFTLSIENSLSFSLSVNFFTFKGACVIPRPLKSFPLKYAAGCGRYTYAVHRVLYNGISDGREGRPLARGGATGTLSSDTAAPAALQFARCNISIQLSAVKPRTTTKVL